MCTVVTHLPEAVAVLPLTDGRGTLEECGAVRDVLRPGAYTRLLLSST